MSEHLHFAPRLPDEGLVSARLYADREVMLHALPKGGVVAEVGTETGYFSNLIIAVCEPAEFHLIDIDFGPLQSIPFPVEKHEGDSSTILSAFPPEHFDWLYIDGDHGYAGVTKDLRAAHRVLKPGGFLVCNDYATWCSPSAQPYGVAKAVNELIISEDYSVLGLAFHPWGLHDILIQKPGH